MDECVITMGQTSAPSCSGKFKTFIYDSGMTGPWTKLLILGRPVISERDSTTEKS